VVVGAGLGAARAHQAVRLAAEVTHGSGQMLGNMQLEEEQGQEANGGGEGQAAYLDRLRGPADGKQSERGGRGKQSERAANGAPRRGAGCPLPRARGGARGGAGARAGGRGNSLDPTK
jgi:hypothetical protein